jgi:S-adenosylmethionine hydrolase
MNQRIIALLTDFGTKDGYVGAMKGRILTEAPDAEVVDISHNIEPFNIKQAAFCLNNSYAFFPEKTIFVAVVDPGVGTKRQGLLIKTAHHYFIGPDNGVFSFIYSREACRVFRIVEEALPWDISPTFHGRDVFSPIACLISTSSNMDNYIEPVTEHFSFIHPFKKLDDQHYLLSVLHIDRFGNVIFNFHQKDHVVFGQKSEMTIVSKGRKISGILKTFGEVSESELLITWDSTGYLQLAKNMGNASRTLNLRTGDEVELIL